MPLLMEQVRAFPDEAFSLCRFLFASVLEKRMLAIKIPDRDLSMLALPGYLGNSPSLGVFLLPPQFVCLVDTHTHTYTHHPTPAI